MSIHSIQHSNDELQKKIDQITEENKVLKELVDQYSITLSSLFEANRSLNATNAKLSCEISELKKTLAASNIDQNLFRNQQFKIRHLESIIARSQLGYDIPNYWSRG